MVGGGNRRDEGSFTVNSTNVFAALDSLRKKKKSDKDKGLSKGVKGTSKAGESKEAQAKKQVFWAPAPLTSKSWADVDDEDDDDYYATTAPPQAWGSNKPKETFKPDLVEESESEDELFDEVDEVEEEHDIEAEAREETRPVLQKPVEAPPAPKDTERQLSKKERKKKELAELEAILADFGVNPKEKSGDEPSDVSKDQIEGQANGDVEKKNINLPPVESKSAKKKKKKEKASKEVAKEAQDQPNSSGAPNGPEGIAGSEQADEDASSAIDMKEKLKRLASAKKKKSSKEMDSSARAAAVEAAARNAKLAAAKKKEKSHYNQQPMR